MCVCVRWGGGGVGELNLALRELGEFKLALRDPNPRSHLP